MTKLLGIVACGGKSLRMGTDKGLIPINDTCWAKHAANKLYSAGLNVSISINPTQTENYGAFFTNGQMVIDNFEMKGPLAGLLSVHLKHPANDLFLLACDMIDMQITTIDHLIKTYSDEPWFDLYAYQNGDHAEPFCAIYTAKALKELFTTYDTAKLSGMSLQKVFDQGLTKRCDPLSRSSFNNYNSPTTTTIFT